MIGRSRGCVCGDGQLCGCAPTPPPGARFRWWRPRDINLMFATLQRQLDQLTETVRNL